MIVADVIAKELKKEGISDIFMLTVWSNVPQ